MNNDITWGGFIKSNIKRAVLKDVLESGDPVNYFRALEDAVEGIRDDIIENYDDDIYKYFEEKGLGNDDS